MKNILKKILLFIGISIILMVFVMPLLMLPFVHILPYMHSLSLWQRLPLYLLVFIASYLIAYMGAQPRNRKVALRLFKERLIVNCLGFGFFIFGATWLAANSLGLLVKVFPNAPYSKQVEVLGVKAHGSKYKFVDLELKSDSKNSLYYLTLSKKHFNYLVFNKGDRLMLKGYENCFGVYVERIGASSGSDSLLPHNLTNK